MKLSVLALKMIEKCSINKVEWSNRFFTYICPMPLIMNWTGVLGSGLTNETKLFRTGKNSRNRERERVCRKERKNGGKTSRKADATFADDLQEQNSGLEIFRRVIYAQTFNNEFEEQK